MTGVQTCALPISPPDGPAGQAGDTFVTMPGDATSPPFRRRAFPLPDVPFADLYPIDRGIPPVRANEPVDADGVPMRVENGRLHATPTGITFQGLRRLAAYEATGDRAYLDVVIGWAQRLRTLMREEGDALWVRIPWNDADQGLAAPWDNALAQGTALALYARLHRLTGDPAWLAIADGLFHGFERIGPRDGPWVGHVVDGYLWFEHYVKGVRGRVLNAHLYAAFGLRDYWQETRSPDARLLAEAAFTTVRELGERFRRPGDYSWYNLTDRIAIPGYHRFHIRQLRAAAVATGDPWFAALADRMLADRRPPLPVEIGRAHV